MLSPEQMQKIWDISDTTIYREAVAFIHRLVKSEGYDPLPPSQVRGLLNITGNSSYTQIETFIIHQRDRDWTPRQRNIKVFYTELEKIFIAMRSQRLRREFHLVDEQAPPQVLRQQVDMLMVFIVREFLQHLIAENNVLVQEKKGQHATPYPKRPTQSPRQNTPTNSKERQTR
ncbi:hypothetical protein [Dictyobacter aurantiacus]|uniref:Uncharacterized protein n=1 Tax=Dictyobacter aurantiacus TaxID=1936993 RepID=A0A401ZR87_9CHLR|nr:hypothetical protein [Dictyobacter aurantiacus]GCE09296.1 hypothetical protein KDAU_66250 [Dictyobacter aurantiacus]